MSTRLTNYFFKIFMINRVIFKKRMKRVKIKKILRIKTEKRTVSSRWSGRAL